MYVALFYEGERLSLNRVARQMAAECRLYLAVAVGWSMSARQDRHPMPKAILMSNGQRGERNPVILHCDCGAQFTRGLSCFCARPSPSPVLGVTCLFILGDSTTRECVGGLEKQ